MITMPTTIARTMPGAICGTPKYSCVMSATLQVWNMLPPVNAETSSVTQKMPPMSLPSHARLGFHLAMPLLTTHIAPPCGLSGSSVLR